MESFCQSLVSTILENSVATSERRKEQMIKQARKEVSLTFVESVLGNDSIIHSILMRKLYRDMESIASLPARLGIDISKDPIYNMTEELTRIRHTLGEIKLREEDIQEDEGAQEAEDGNIDIGDGEQENTGDGDLHIADNFVDMGFLVPQEDIILESKAACCIIM